MLPSVKDLACSIIGYNAAPTTEGITVNASTSSLPFLPGCPSAGDKPPVTAEAISVDIFLLPGEEPVVQGSSDGNFLLLTNYRFVCIAHSQVIIVPVRSIDSVEVIDNSTLGLSNKDGRTEKLSFSSNKDLAFWVGHIENALNGSEDVEALFAFQYCRALVAVKEKLPEALGYRDHCSDFLREFNRMEFSKNLWRVSEVNSRFSICKSYPKLSIVPVSVEDADLIECAKFRKNNRFPAVVWRHPGNGAVIARCSQPNVGILLWRNSADEKVLQAIAGAPTGAVDDAAMQGRKPMLIVDARTYTSAMMNRALGGGSEVPDYNSGAEVQFMNMGNIHQLRKSFAALRPVLSADAEPITWLSTLERSLWLESVSLLLRAALIVTEAISKKARSVLVHCTDGWDRTAQITSLAELLLDPYYRRFEGFMILIEREWLDFGHKFGDRYGNGCKRSYNSERSPIFILWLDSVFQLMKQFPTAFEFNETFLVKLAQHASSCLFGNFLCNSPSERIALGVHQKTLSLWSFLRQSDTRFVNYLYDRDAHKVLIPQNHVRHLELWKSFYCQDYLNHQFAWESLVTVTSPSSESVGFRKKDDTVSSPATSISVPSSPSPIMGTHFSVFDDELLNQAPFRAESGMNGVDLLREAESRRSGSSPPIYDILTQPSYENRGVDVGVVQKTFHSGSLHLDSAPHLMNGDVGVAYRSTSIGSVVRPRPRSYPDLSSIPTDCKHQHQNRESSLQSQTQCCISVPWEMVKGWIGDDGLITPIHPLESRLIRLVNDYEQRLDQIRLSRQDLDLPSHFHSQILKGFGQKQQTVDVGVPSSRSSLVLGDESWEQIHHDEAQPVLWVPDHAAVRCTSCDTEFGLTLRRHHCRNCGLVFCARCACQRTPVPEEQLYDPVRVCNSCFDLLSTQQDHLRTPCQSVTSSVDRGAAN